MVGTRAAIRYAKAILELAIEKDNAAVVDEDMKLIKSTIANNKELQVALKSPVIKSEDKIAVLKEIFKNVSEITKGLFNILEENRRIELLQTVSEKYIIQYNAYKGKQTAVVTTAVALTKELEAKVLAKVKELTSKDVTLENKIDPSIIGGFILRVGDQQFDASVSSKFSKLEREFSNNLYVSQL
ncbi:F-type H+-transporting ATPase subunit delta [Pustulibacterium marinum]|uniref:ATP synthase subunit delta n=1 Tax=Pustulibacterium marinum TaxID=1224947 RepID=A0A1I7EU44_9FLAO|nr:ATP synthase F1 subunit delta [Pustulibacterium marinum]SFU27408.1 F-type H+-transporting ATPase subunit delta [Pustulibacterium marinum]